jgi:hypothetical protein
VVCRDVRAVLAGIRTLGLTRAGQPATGLSCDFTIGSGDIPAEPEQGEPGRDLAPEVMRILCDSLDTLQPAEVKTAVQIGIDTGRRPEDILDLPLDCLQRDKNGAAVLVYDNAKAHRLDRRLPISQATTAVIIAQQNFVRQRFPHTPLGELKLLPSPRRNPTGRRPITIAMLDQRHREWVTALPTLRTGDGVEVDKTRIVPYAYRHTYAQRHADAGVPIDVLADLLDHRNLNVTRRYYRIGEDRRRDAVDRVTALSFDRHGNRVWRDAQALLESEHARYAIGQVAVPFGTCTEPSNVQAGGGACPVRYRCAGCDHFRIHSPCCARSCCRLGERVWLASGNCSGLVAGRRRWARRPGSGRTSLRRRPRPALRRLGGRILLTVSAGWGSGSDSRSWSRRMGGWTRG